MKERSIEEKAKRYDELFAKAKTMMVENTNEVDGAEILTKLFPQLAESENEKIRKAIKKALQVRCDGSRIISDEPVTLEEAIAWLERQGEPTEINPSEFDLRLNKLLKQFETLPKEELVNCLSLYLNVVQNNGIYKDEKQGEQKPISHKFRIGDKVKKGYLTYTVEDIDEDSYKLQAYSKDGEKGCTVFLTIGYEKDYELVEQKTADKVEPKFHEGEWIIHHGTENIYQVVAIIDNQYQLKYGDNYTTQYSEDVDRCARLWDITKDAKAGDVLAAEGFVFIFKEIREDKGVGYFCANENALHEGDDNTFHIANPNSLIGSINNDFTHYTPATKEQRDTLEKAIADAGYIFDFAKKELKKIEQKPTEWSEKKTKGLDELETYILSIVPNRPLDAIKVDSKNIRFLINKEQKPAWSEEDEKMVGNIRSIIVKYAFSQSAVDVNGELCEKEFIDADTWLKSLKERYTWNPSDEQITWLYRAADDASKDSRMKQVLNELLSDLKKLKG